MSQIFDTLRRLEEKRDDLPVDLAAEAQAMFQDAIPAPPPRPTARVEQVAIAEEPEVVEKFEIPEKIEAVETVEAVEAAEPVGTVEVEKEPEPLIPPPVFSFLEQVEPAQPKRQTSFIFDASMIAFAMILFLAIFFATGDLLRISKLLLAGVFATLAVLYYALRAVLKREPARTSVAAGPVPVERVAPPPAPITVPAPEDNRALAGELVLANRILAKEGVVDPYAHISVRSDRNPNHYFVAPRRAAGLVTAADVAEYDFHDQPVNGGPSLGGGEHLIHGAIYQARPDVMAIACYHAPELIPFAASTIPLLPVTHMAGFLEDGIPVFEIPDADLSTDAHPPRFEHALADRLGDRPAVLIRGRGAVVVATSLQAVVGRCFYLNMNARLQEQAIRLGGNVTYLEAEEARNAAPQDGYERAWELWTQKADLSSARST